MLGSAAWGGAGVYGVLHGAGVYGAVSCAGDLYIGLNRVPLGG